MARGGTRIAQPTKLSSFRYNNNNNNNNNNQRVPDVDGVVMSVYGVVSGEWCLTGGLAPHCSTVRTTVSSHIRPADHLRTFYYCVVLSLSVLDGLHVGCSTTAAGSGRKISITKQNFS